MSDTEFSLSDSLDHAILMHRDAHFGGKFDIMLDYYRKGGKGASPEFSVEQIERLAGSESKLKQNLAGMLLTGVEAERVSQAKEAYKKLRDLYEHPQKGKYTLLIADLILSEEEEPKEEIEAIVKEKSTIVPALIDLLRAEDFHDPLFPGYGYGPALAAKCLGLIADKRSIIALFETLSGEDFFEEDVILDALKAIGEPAKQFLLKVVHGRPLNEDNERAAIALIKFKEDPEVCATCLNMLKDLEVRKHIPLATYLVLACEGLKDPASRQEFLKLVEDPQTSKMLKQDMIAVSHHWSD